MPGVSFHKHIGVVAICLLPMACSKGPEKAQMIQAALRGNGISWSTSTTIPLRIAS